MFYNCFILIVKCCYKHLCGYVCSEENIGLKGLALSTDSVICWVYDHRDRKGLFNSLIDGVGHKIIPH